MKDITVKNYIMAIYKVGGDKKIVRTVEISEMLGRSPSSVTETFQKMFYEGLIEYVPYKGVKLTKKGKEIAEDAKQKHIMLHNFMIILGIDDKIADEDACRMEHVLNPETLARLTKFVEFVRKKEEGPRWLDHFKYFFETGEYIVCTPAIQDTCPVHKKAESKSKK